MTALRLPLGGRTRLVNSTIFIALLQSVAKYMFLFIYRNVFRLLEIIFTWSTSGVLLAMHHWERIAIMRRMGKHIAGMQRDYVFK